MSKFDIRYKTWREPSGDSYTYHYEVEGIGAAVENNGMLIYHPLEASRSNTYCPQISKIEFNEMIRYASDCVYLELEAEKNRLEAEWKPC